MKRYLIIALLLFCSICQAADPQVADYWQTDKGINQFLDPAIIGDEYLSDASNVYYWKNCITTRNGYEKYNETAIAAKPVRHLYQFIELDNDSHFMAYCGTDLYYSNNLDGTWTSINSTRTDGSFADSVTFNISGAANWIFFNGDHPQKWNGAAASTSDLGGTPNHGSIAEVWRQRIFMAGVTTYPSNLFYCVPGDAEDWSGLTSGEVIIDPQDGQKITGISSTTYAGSELYGYLVIFKDHKTYLLIHTAAQEPSEGDLIEVSGTIGCVNNNTIIKDDKNNIYFMASDGFYLLSGNTIQKISDPICDTWTNIDKSRLSYVTAGIVPQYKQIWWSASKQGSTSNDIILVFRYDTGAWTIYEGTTDKKYNRDSFCSYTSSTGIQLYGGNSTGTVYTDFYGTTDDGEAIDWEFKTKWYSQGMINLYKLYSRILTLIEEGGEATIYIDTYFDYNEDSVEQYELDTSVEGSEWDYAEFDSGTFGMSAAIRTVTQFPEYQRGYALKLGFSGSKYASIKGWKTEFTPIDRWDL